MNPRAAAHPRHRGLLSLRDHPSQPRLKWFQSNTFEGKAQGSAEVNAGYLADEESEIILCPAANVEAKTILFSIDSDLTGATEFDCLILEIQSTPRTTKQETLGAYLLTPSVVSTLGPLECPRTILLSQEDESKS